MAKPISETPTLYGKEARRFLKKMEEAPTKKDNQFWEEAESQRNAPF